MKSFFFFLRHTLTWAIVLGFALAIIGDMNDGQGPPWPFVVLAAAKMLWEITRAISHVRRVRLVAGRVDLGNLASRHRRQVELPFPPDQAFAIVDAAIRELPHVQKVESARDSLQVRARIARRDAYAGVHEAARRAFGSLPRRENRVLATVTPGDRTGSLAFVCEPEGGAWRDWFTVDDGTNLENAEALTRAISRRVAEHRKGEESIARETATEKELTVARLSLLHAQVEPHFLYNTLASAQVLTRGDPARADLMLGHLITYLRHSLPRTDEPVSTLGAELERARAYLEILKIRMGDRLTPNIQVPPALERTPMPPMMLQTLVENAIKHGLEPVPGGGSVWVMARDVDGKVAITVADDGRGFSEEGGGTGIGLKNVRERLRLAYGDAASFSIVANFPRGVAATITLPASLPAAGDAA